MTKLCAKCGDELGDGSDDVLVRAVQHWLDAHPRDDKLHDILTSAWVEIDCVDCGQAFFSPVSYGAGRIGAEAYCPDCNSEGFREVMAQALDAEALIEREADPLEDDLDNRRVYDA